MCGLVGLVGTHPEPSVTDAQLCRVRDLLAHRGPDGHGLVRLPHVALAHRRLAVIDPTPAGAQPMSTPDRRFTLVYNGELYNDAELRGQLREVGVRFRTACDTETLLLALATWGVGALARVRGMYAFVFWDSRERSLLLARDALGVKPLYWTRRRTPAGDELLFASELPALASMPGVDIRPDAVSVSAYLTTIRTTLGPRTLFAGLRTVLPGQWMHVRVEGESLRIESGEHWPDPGDASDADIGGAVEGSVVAHLRSDVPTCTLLSGGLDSSILALIASTHTDRLHTYCSGAREDADTGDFVHARLVADAIGVDHTEAPVTRGVFAQRWADMVARQGLPLSTPNEVAINEVARVLRSRGHVVTLSGEGADELFGGYEPPLMAAAAHVDSGNAAPGVFQLDSAAWVPRGSKAAVLSEDIWRAAEGDAHLVEHYEHEFASVAGQRGPDDPLAAHLRFHRRVNLGGLLARLDTATMLESVEGRTPFADRCVADLGESLPMARRFVPPRGESPARTKIALREAFRERLPASVVDRPKASFPLPFQSWVADLAPGLAGSPGAGMLFSPVAVRSVLADPSGLWNLAWPMINLSLWADRWWGR